MARHYYWLKLNDDFFRDSSVKKLRSIAGGDTYTIIYLKLLLLSLPTDGKLYYEGLDEDFASQVALEIDEDVENVKVTLRFLEARRILIQNTDSEFELSTEPEMVGSESESAKRMRKLRQRQLLLSENSGQETSHCDSGVTASDENVTQSKSRDKSKSIELEKELRVREEEKDDKANCKTNVKTLDSANADTHTNDATHKYGEYGWVRLTDEQYRKLLTEYGEAELKRCITYIDESAQSSKNKNGWKDWNLVIRRCHRDRWGLPKGEAKPTRRVANYDYDDDTELPY